uniref:Uncharacterized protein n=1 Tax=Anguilla anguilla TaxID=7936 RepID=A0A0E9SY53_ANGAN
MSNTATLPQWRHGLIYHRAETRSNADTRSPLGDSTPSLTVFGRNPSHS